MQGHKAAVSSLSEFFDIEHGSASSNAALDQQLYWGNIQDSIDAQATDNLPATPFLNPFINEPQNLLDDQRYSQCDNPFSSNHVSVGPQLGQSSSSRSVPLNLNMSPGFVGQGSASSPLVESETFKSNISEFQWLQPSSSSAPFNVSSSLGSAHFGKASASHPSSSMEGRLLPCKRKNFHVEGYMGQSSIAGSSTNAQNAECSLWPQVNLGIQEQVEPRLVLGASGNSERSRRSFNQRMGPCGSNPSSVGGLVAHSILPNSGILAANSTNSLANGGVSPPLLPAPVMHAPAPFPPSGFSVRWNGDMMVRSGSSSSVVASQEGGSSSNSRNILEHPMFVSANEASNFVQSPAAVQSVGAGTVRVPGNVGLSSRSGSHHASSSSSQNARRLQAHRRYSELVRRSLNAAESDAIAAYRSRNNLVLSSAASQETAALPLRSGSSSHGRHPWPLRQGDNLLGLPPPVRTIPAGSEGRRRFLSEMRNVLDMMRRGEALRNEDFMILDQSMFVGAMAQANDRHRDMRLDVDNMSYEELLALEERIGNVSTGASEETVLTELKQRKFQSVGGVQTEMEPCCICQEEYNDGEDVGRLECGHDFHRECIKEWLKHKNICPICKTKGLKSTYVKESSVSS